MRTSILVFLKTFDAGGSRSIERAKVALTAVTGTSVLAGIVSKLCRFEILYKHMPKNKADCTNLEPLDELYRGLGGLPVRRILRYSHT